MPVIFATGVYMHDASTVLVSGIPRSIGCHITKRLVYEGQSIVGIYNCIDLFALTGFRPQTDLRTGLRKFVEWYREYRHGERGS
jgi:nucleoside-diphosphate-sugar epimerase